MRHFCQNIRGQIGLEGCCESQRFYTFQFMSYNLKAKTTFFLFPWKKIEANTYISRKKCTKSTKKTVFHMIQYKCFYYTTCTYVIFECSTNIYFLQEFDTVKKIEKLQILSEKQMEFFRHQNCFTLDGISPPFALPLVSDMSFAAKMRNLYATRQNHFQLDQGWQQGLFTLGRGIVIKINCK